MSRRERTPMDHQRAAVRQELHELIDRLVDDWQWIDSLSSPLRAAAPSEGGSAKGSHPDPTVDALGNRAMAWLDRFRKFRVEARLVDAERAKMAPAKPKRKGLRENTVEVCVRCQMPAPKVHRIDSHPYCATSCYYAEHRERGTWAKTGS